MLRLLLLHLLLAELTQRHAFDHLAGTATATLSADAVTGEHPRVLGTATLAGIHHQAATLERHAGERAGHDFCFRAMQDERAQIDMA